MTDTSQPEGTEMFDSIFQFMTHMDQIFNYYTIVLLFAS